MDFAMTPSPSPSTAANTIVSVVSGIDWSKAANALTSVFSSGNVGIIAAGVLLLILVGIGIFYAAKIRAAEQEAAQAASNTTDSNVHNGQPGQSGSQETDIAANQSKLSDQEKADLLKFLQGVSGAELLDVATKAYGAQAVQSATGPLVDGVEDVLTADQRQQVYKLYGVV